MENVRIAMSTIPTTFNEHQIARTVFGGINNYSEDSLNISVILLNNSGSQFKLPVFENLLKCNFQSIISIEHDPNNFTIDDLSKKVPSVKFIVPQEKTTDGELINIAMAELKSEYVLVLRDTLYIPSGVILKNLAERLTADGIYCIVPRLVDNKRNGVLCQFIPGVAKNKFEIESSTSVGDGVKTLYPFDCIGLYNREKFIQLGGFDYTIQSPYWQNLDLGIRSWLWGEETKLTTMLQFSYIDEAPIEDKTVNLDYLRYYLKNELPKIKLDQGIIKLFSYFKFQRRSSCGMLEARKQFNEAREWVYQNRFKFKKDLEMLIHEWEMSK